MDCSHYNPTVHQKPNRNTSRPSTSETPKQHSRVSIRVFCKELVLRDVSQFVFLLLHLPLKKRLAQLRRASGDVLVRQRDIQSSQRDAALQTTTDVTGKQAEIRSVGANIGLWVGTGQWLEGSRDALRAFRVVQEGGEALRRAVLQFMALKCILLVARRLVVGSKRPVLQGGVRRIALRQILVLGWRELVMLWWIKHMLGSVILECLVLLGRGESLCSRAVLVLLARRAVTGDIVQPANLHRVQRNRARLVLDVYNVLKQIRTAVVLWVVFMSLLHVIHRSWCLGWRLSGKKNNKKKIKTSPRVLQV